MGRTDGSLTIDEVIGCPGWPGEEIIEKKSVAVLECVEDIPCNPCEVVCPQGAITVGSPITNLPAIEGEKCSGCALCIAACPGLAIFVVDKHYSTELAAVSLPYELLPWPEKGDPVEVFTRSGERLCRARVVRVQKPKSFDKTAVVTIALKKKFINDARSIIVEPTDE